MDTLLLVMSLGESYYLIYTVLSSECKAESPKVPKAIFHMNGKVHFNWKYSTTCASRALLVQLVAVART